MRDMNIDERLSCLFIYYNARLYRKPGAINDDGATKKATALALRKFGVCSESLWKYDVLNVNKKPPPEIYRIASRVTVKPLKVPRNINAIKTCLANQVPVIIGIRMGSIDGNEVRANNGYLRRLDPNDPCLDEKGYRCHSVVLVGYDEKAKHFIARNSWGRNWGLDGYFYVPYEDIMAKNLVNYPDGIWSITEIMLRTSHMPNVGRLYVPGYNLDGQRPRQLYTQILPTLHRRLIASVTHGYWPRSSFFHK
ncbi:unnamed protein product [Rotaria sp. Silwood2]|nr:unnamed protein product [Rotaria sp. Silwood2]CAF3200276.1 unnamed protein product [Rotaria sp. Silwood2]CAF4194068.1 unnamed protein product [Rotaria sp. Silwood2]